MSKLYPKCNQSNVLPYKSIGPYFCDQVFNKYNITVFPSHYFYPVWWGSNNKAIIMNQTKEQYPDSFMCQYGYTTNNL